MSDVTPGSAMAGKTPKCVVCLTPGFYFSAHLCSSCFPGTVAVFCAFTGFC